MEIKKVTNKEEWEGFLQGCRDKTFLQSWNWGEFQKLIRGRVWRLGVYEEENLVAVSLVVKVVARRGTFLLLPHGPVTKPGEQRKEAILSALLPFLKDVALKEKASFIRFNPIWERVEENVQLFRKAGFKDAPSQMHPEASWKLDITLDLEELLSQMRKTTRYLIRQAAKNQDITIERSSSRVDVELFSRMHEKVSRRQAFVPFSLEYLQGEFEAFSKDNQVLLFLAKYKSNVAAASFVVFWSGIGFYHHAVSLPEFAKLSLSYLLLWEALKEAKRRGCVLYDFWGYVDPKTQPKHPWAGPTLFKQGFGGEAKLYVKTQDYPVSLKYWFTAFFETVRRIRRHL
ncbi:peptidoglycan bridge formation glycyltransferase FemA/FemB family protein [Patescibacteria group bacterium]|nr:peptidoglycan bridge formation glycyltransferase FemA/FemB family protein [Patescibacteria group bacterium]